MAGLVPAIHALTDSLIIKDVDGRHKYHDRTGHRPVPVGRP
jgi:hypothetical protein